MRLTKLTGHALRILIECARSGGDLVKTAEIAERLDITPKNVFKIVHILAHSGFIAAVRGPSGGVRLARPPNQIRIGDVVRATEITEVDVGDAASVPAIGAAASGPINRVLDDALGAFISVLDQHTLQDMLNARSDETGAATRGAQDKVPRGRASPRSSTSSGGNKPGSRRTSA